MISISIPFLAVAALALHPQGAGVPTDELVSVGPRTWAWISSDEASANGALFVGDDAALVVDPGATPRIAERFLEAVAEVTDKPVRTVILTHWHPDHALGAVALEGRDFELISSGAARATMAERLATQRLATAESLEDPGQRSALLAARLNLPDSTLEEPRVFDLGNHRVEVLPSEPAHTTGDLFVRSIEDNVLVAGDLFFRDSCTSMGEGNLLNWIWTLDRILISEPRVIVPGHFALSAGEHLRRFRNYLVLTMATAGKAAFGDEQAYSEAWAEYSKETEASFGDFRQFPRYGATFEDNFRATLEELSAQPPPLGWRAGFELLDEELFPTQGESKALEWTGPNRTAEDGQGRLEFALGENHRELVVTDVWNGVQRARVALDTEGAGVQALDALFACAVLLPSERRIDLINTASMTPEGSLLTAEGPVAFIASTDQRFGFVALAPTQRIDVYDLAAQPQPRVIARLPLESAPHSLALSADGSRLWVACDSTPPVAIGIPAAASKEHVALSADDGTEVIVLGMIHGAHRTSQTWGLEQLRETIRRIDPDVVCTEIPPERWQRAWDEFAREGVVREPRVRRFPEYVDCLFDLRVQMGFAIEPCAGWTQEMNDLRNRLIASFAAEYPEDQAAMEAEEAAIAQRHAADPMDEEDPRQIHSERFDARTKESLGPYDRYLNDWIGPGGWTNINAAHYALIEAAIARHRGERILVTFGAGHKYWILEQLRARGDLTVLDPAPFLP